MIFSVEFFIYLATGLAIVALFYLRRKGLAALKSEAVPELSGPEFLELKKLLAASYERTLYLGVSFLLLAFATVRASEMKAFCILLTVGLFIYNIPPRQKAMRILASAEISWKDLKERRISL